MWQTPQFYLEPFLKTLAFSTGLLCLSCPPWAEVTERKVFQSWFLREGDRHASMRK